MDSLSIKQITRYSFLILIVAVLFIVVYVVVQTVIVPSQTDESGKWMDDWMPSESRIESLVSVITLPAPGDIGSDEEDLEDYNERVSRRTGLHSSLLNREHRLTSVDITNRFADVSTSTSADLIVALTTTNELQGMHAELTRLGYYFDEVFNREAPYERFDSVEGPLMFYSQYRSIYPNTRAITIIFHEQILSFAEPDLAEEYRLVTDGLLEELVVAGIVMKTDIEVSRILVDHYMELHREDPQFLQAINQFSNSSL